MLFLIGGPWRLAGGLTGGSEAWLKSLTTWTGAPESQLEALEAWLAIYDSEACIVLNPNSALKILSYSMYLTR